MINATQCTECGADTEDNHYPQCSLWAIYNQWENNMSLDSWPIKQLKASTTDVFGSDTVKSVKAELELCITYYGDETPMDHLDAILAEVRRELLPFCEEIEARRTTW